MVLAVAACAPEYSYAPTTNATLTTRGDIVASYRIPPSSPQGDVRVVSLGLTGVRPPGSNEPVRALHVRVSLADTSATPWTFDTREQKVELRGRPPLPLLFATASPGGTEPPVLTMDRTNMRVVDLYFALPADLQHADSLPEFDLVWSVRVGTSTSTQRTPFERIKNEPISSPGDTDILR